ncbi:hypothetical protein AAOGI_01460 [Agarivorans albus]
MVKVTIGVLSYKRTKDLVSLLTDLITISVECRLVIVNNDPELDIYQYVEFVKCNKFIDLVYLNPGKNLGVAGGRNLILDQAVGEYTILFDDDLHIPDINLILSTCSNIFKKSEYGGIAFNVKDFHSGGYSRYEIPHANKKVDMNSEFDTYLMIGAGHALKNDFFKKNGGYPSDFGLYGMEEIDLSFKLISKGKRIKYHPNLVVHHKKSPVGRLPQDDVMLRLFINKSKIAKRYFPYINYLTTLTVWGAVYLIKTRQLIKFFRAVRSVASYRTDDTDRISESGLGYIRGVSGRLWF